MQQDGQQQARGDTNREPGQGLGVPRCVTTNPCRGAGRFKPHVAKPKIPLTVPDYELIRDNINPVYRL
jgi:hypothetical protein